VARVLRPDGVFLANIADGPPVRYSRRVVATVQQHFASVMLIAEPAIVKGRRHGNIVLAAGPADLPADEIRRASARAPFPRTVTDGSRLRAFAAGAAPLTDADAQRSPVPPDEQWRVADWPAEG
jgi:hypothetical protein